MKMIIKLMNSTSTNSTIPSTYVSIYFKIHYQCIYGQAVYLIGDQPITGCWNPKNGIRMTRNEVSNIIMERETIGRSA